MDFEALREQFKSKKHKNIAFTDLKELLEIKLKQMIAMNKTRGTFLSNFQDVINRYNNGSLVIEEAYAELVKTAAEMTEEEQRAAKMGMTEEQLEIFDLLKKEQLTKKEEGEVKEAATTLLEVLLDAQKKILIPEWHKEKATQEMVKQEIKKLLHDTLPNSYDRQIFSDKAEVIFRHFYELAEMESGYAA